jgi:hypothetical protein
MTCYDFPTEARINFTPELHGIRNDIDSTAAVLLVIVPSYHPPRV